MRRRTSSIAAALLLAASVAAQKAPSAPTTTSSSGNAKPLRFASPIQSYTIFDKPPVPEDGVSARGRYLPRLRTGLAAERRARETLLDEQRRGIGIDDEYDGGAGGDWAEASAEADEKRRKASERRIETAYDEAVGGYDRRAASKRALSVASLAESTRAAKKGKRGKEYQFVGVVNDGRGRSEKDGDVTWYARRKPKNARWSVRLVHVNRDAVLRDLFVRGKVDVFARYVNNGVDESASADDGGEGGSEAPGLRPLVTGEYEIRERSWRTLWNFSPRRMLHQPSGSFWRERRLAPGLYTDGATVYETAYRYRDGKNGMKAVAKLEDFLASPGLGYEEKMRVVERLKGGDRPDVVVEK